MRRRKPNTWVQVNLRVKEELRRELETAAKENQVSFNDEVRRRLTESFQIKSLNSTIAAVPKMMRSLIGDIIRESQAKRTESPPAPLSTKPPQRKEKEANP